MSKEMSRLGGRILGTRYATCLKPKDRLRLTLALQEVRESLDELPDDVRAMADEALKQIPDKEKYLKA